jgi:hypothetical protein
MKSSRFSSEVKFIPIYRIYDIYDIYGNRITYNVYMICRVTV